MSNILETILIAFYIYILLSTISVLILENRNPVKSVAWLVILIFVPFVGLFLYLILGQDYRKRKMISRKSIQRINQRPCAAIDIKELENSGIDIKFRKLIQMLKRNSEADAYTHNKIDVYAEGENIFDSMFEAIRNA
jgi:cardiolipin synthase